MSFLLDINVLIALIDPAHMAHEAAHRWFDTDRVRTAAQVTDTYLLALAIAHDGRLATFDRRLSGAAVPRGKTALYQIGS